MFFDQQCHTECEVSAAFVNIFGKPLSLQMSPKASFPRNMLSRKIKLSES